MRGDYLVMFHLIKNQIKLITVLHISDCYFIIKRYFCVLIGTLDN